MPVKRNFYIYKALAAACLIAGGPVLLPVSSPNMLFAASPAQAALQRGSGLAQSFSGAYLAGSYAANQGNPAASAYFRRALYFRPNDKIVQQELLLSLVENGDFAEAVQIANAMRKDSDATIKPIVQLILAANAFKKQRYADVNAAVGAAGNKNESLLWVFFTSWADFGRWQKDRALHNLQQARFSEWYAFLSVYNTALMQDLNNNHKQAIAAYEKALGYKQMAEMAPEAYEHLLIAYTGFTRRINGKVAALRQLDRGQALLNVSSSVLQTLRRDLEQGKTIPRLINNPAQGAAEFAYDIGSTFLRAGEDLYADIYLQTALFLRPGDDAVLFRLGVLAAKAKQREKANAFFAQIPQSSPYFDDMEFLVALGINQNLADSDDKAQKKNTQAAADLEKMIARSPDKAALQNILANIYLQNDNYPAAIALLDTMLGKIAKPDKKDWILYFQRGFAYERNKNWEKAEADFREALHLNPQNADVLNYYGYSLVDRSIKLETALDMVRKAAELRPQDGAIIDSLGWAYYKLGRYDEAVITLEKAVRLDPSESSINDHLGDAYWKTGKKRDAVFQWNHALAFRPEPEAETAIRAKLLYGLQDKAAAEDMETAEDKARKAAP